MLKRIILITGIVLLMLFSALFALALFSENGDILLPVSHKEAFNSDDPSKYPLPLKTTGNQIINSNNEIVSLKGIMPIDPAKYHMRNKMKKNLVKDLVTDIKNTGSNIIRIPVHPDYWTKDNDYLWRNLDPIVEEAGKQGLYVIIDWHCIGNIDTGKGVGMPDSGNVKSLTLEFWKQVSEYFKNTPHVIFEIFNEPSEISEEAWRSNANAIINEIRSQDAAQLILVGSPEFSSNLSWVASGPLEQDNIAYSVHIFPSHQLYKWDMLFGDVSQTYPVLVTEWGFIDENSAITEQKYLVGSVGTYGKPLMEYLEEHKIGWIACWYDYEWEPPMLEKDGKNYTTYGEFVLSQF